MVELVALVVDLVVEGAVLKEEGLADLEGFVLADVDAVELEAVVEEVVRVEVVQGRDERLEEEPHLLELEVRAAHLPDLELALQVSGDEVHEQEALVELRAELVGAHVDEIVQLHEVLVAEAQQLLVAHDAPLELELVVALLDAQDHEVQVVLLLQQERFVEVQIATEVLDLEVLHDLQQLLVLPLRDHARVHVRGAVARAALRKAVAAAIVDGAPTTDLAPGRAVPPALKISDIAPELAAVSHQQKSGRLRGRWSRK